MARQQAIGITTKFAFNLVIAGSLSISVNEISEAAEKKSYTAPPFGSFSSQMSDALLGGGKYEKPVWNLHDAINLPKWLDLSIEQRTRYETMDGQFIKGRTGGNQQIPLQTDVFLQAHLGKFRFGTEFLDARAADESDYVNNTQVDTADFIQGYLAWADQNVFYSGLGAEVIAGRQTLNLGSRRLVARNVFRNTINSFTGVRLRLVDYEKWQFNGFVTMPVLRLPAEPEKILDGVHEWDEEDTHTWFSGGILEINDLYKGVNSEVYLYYLNEGDTLDRPTRNRRYFTPGMRFFLKPKVSQYDFQLETIGQLGTIQASNTNTTELDQEAWYVHLDVGYTFDVPWKPRLALEYDYASGDENPNDDKNQRFDTLYGARRFEFGPTGIYGAFARSNINTPGLAVKFAPRSDLTFNANYRAFWLAADKDAWVTANLRDPTGNTADHIGEQLEMSARWNFNSSLNFETGWAHLFKGAFAKEAPGAPPPEDVDYFYVESMLRF
ncbi:alginate export family protein [Methylomonas sp. MgM2]